MKNKSLHSSSTFHLSISKHFTPRKNYATLALLNPRGICSTEQSGDLSQIVRVGFLTWPKLRRAVSLILCPPSPPLSSYSLPCCRNLAERPPGRLICCCCPQHLHFSKHFLHPISLHILENAALTPKSLQDKQIKFCVWWERHKEKRCLPAALNRSAYMLYVFPSFLIFFVYLGYALFRLGILPPSPAFSTVQPQSWLEPCTATTVQTVINKTSAVKRL